MALAEQCRRPVGHALRGKEWIQYDNPYDVGMSGLLGYGAAYEATHEADLLVLLGTDFPYDALPAARGPRRSTPTRAPGPAHRWSSRCTGDVGETIRALLPLVEQKSDRAFLDAMLQEHADALEKVVDAYTRKVEKHSRSTPSTWPRCWTSSPPTTPCSPSTPACATSGRRAT